MESQQVDPCYDPKHLMAELDLRRQPLDLQYRAVDLSTRQEIADSSSERAPMGLLSLVQRKVDTAMLGNMSSYEQGRIWVARNDLVQAKKHFEVALGYGDRRAHNNLGWIAVEAGSHEEAWTHFRSIPQSIQLGVSRCTLHLREAQYEETLNTGKEINTLLTMQAAHMQNVFGGALALTLGRAHRELGEFDASAFYFRQSTSRFNAKAAYELGMLHMHPSFDGYNPQKAIRCFERAILLGNPEGFRGAAMVLLAFGQSKEADQVLAQAAPFGIELSEAERAQIAIERMMSDRLSSKQ